MPATNNLFSDIPEQLPEELFQSLLKQDHVHIERIVSKGHITPTGQWYDQAWDEWLVLLQGQATLSYAQPARSVHLATGDYLLIPAHTRHRVDWTSTGPDAIWLAVHIS